MGDSDVLPHAHPLQIPFTLAVSDEGAVMDAVHEDCFVVFLRRDRNQGERRECDEEPLADCSSYEEARQIKQAYRDSGCECVIRYVGPGGGGD